MFRRRNNAELPVNVFKGNDDTMEFSYSRSHSRSMRQVNVPSLTVMSLVGYIWTALGIFGFFYGIFALVNSKETVELICRPPRENLCRYTPPPWIKDGGYYDFLPRDDGAYMIRRSSIRSPSIVSMEDDVHFRMATKASENRKLNKQVHTVGIGIAKPRGNKAELYMNFQGTNKRQARERVKRFSKLLRAPKTDDIRITDSYYTRSLPILYIILGMFACIFRLIAWDLNGLAANSSVKRTTRQNIQKKSGL